MVGGAALELPDAEVIFENFGGQEVRLLQCLESRAAPPEDLHFSLKLAPVRIVLLRLLSRDSRTKFTDRGCVLMQANIVVEQSLHLNTDVCRDTLPSSG